MSTAMKRTAGILGTLALGLTMAITAAPAAQAHNKAATVDCDTASVSLTSYDQGATATITLDGTILHDGTFNGHLVDSWPTGGNQEHTFTVVVASNDGDQYNMDYSKTTEGCFTPPVTAPNLLTTSHTVGCVDAVPTVTITLRNVSPWIYPVSVEIDGAHSYGPTVDNRTGGTLSGPQKDQSLTRTITFDEDSGDHTVRYRVQAGSENSLYKGLPVGEWTEFTVHTDCQPPVTPVCEDGEEISNGVCAPADEPCPGQDDCDEAFPPALPLDLPTLPVTGPALLPLILATATLLTSAGAIMIRRTRKAL